MSTKTEGQIHSRGKDFGGCNDAYLTARAIGCGVRKRDLPRIIATVLIPLAISESVHQFMNVTGSHSGPLQAFGGMTPWNG
jgi:hypothetical protein